MRILVFLHPTNKRGTKAAYTKLRKFLFADGYLMLQPEVFMRIGTNRKGIEKHLRRIQEYNPGTGVIRILKLTERGCGRNPGPSLVYNRRRSRTCIPTMNG